ncbi:transposase [Oscillatoria sp. FACHB-1406]|uniref:REP-associated tyrosine transposase n=1 Tax=Oscillatoria sp. FACHB-1406 TaxID=2692846 RepID=UPI0016858661|nr:transposase [Oscillatoria sp. FACHB-1406]MBD2580280.1 transposase [Oscillatoria sp. FACHB-1406]
MPQYRRARISGSVIFITCVTYQRQPIFSTEENIHLLRHAIAQTRRERPFEIVGAVILPDHLHFLWQLPPDDCDYSSRVGIFKVLFTRALRGQEHPSKNLSLSRQKHRERDVWQRRFWERSLDEQQDINHYLDYIHYNPVKHQLASCPHAWQYSSFTRYVEKGLYSESWACRCETPLSTLPDFSKISGLVGE